MAIANRAVDHRRQLALVIFVVLGLSLASLAGATGVRWLSANWSAACHRLLRAPTSPSFAAPWRLTDFHPGTHCLRLP